MIELKDGRLASCSSDKTIALWNLTNANRLFCLNGHTKAIIDIIELNDGRIVSASLDGSIRLWDLHVKAGISVLYQCDFGANSLVELPNEHIAAAFCDKVVRILKIGQPESPIDILSGHTLSVTSV